MARIYLTVAEVVMIHYKVLEHSGGLAGIRDQGALEAAVFRPQCGYYVDLLDEAAALLESLVQNHRFHDGNKRTAFVATNTFLKANGQRIAATTEEAERFFLENMARGTFRPATIREWLALVVKPFRPPK